MIVHFITEICFFGILKQCLPCMGKHIIVDFDVSLIHIRFYLQAIRLCQLSMLFPGLVYIYLRSEKKLCLYTFPMKMSLLNDTKGYY
jgi:hypothetical protein